MSVSQEKPEDQEGSTYILDAENAAEMARLIRQDQLITSGMGGVLSGLDLSKVESVLDLGCGPGGWVMDVAYNYSDMEVVGVDISERMITYASARAQVQQRSNVSFHMMNILKPLAFSDASFDLVNARFISGFMLRDSWPFLFGEALRVLRPGGILRLTEPAELAVSNKPHFEKTFDTLMKAMSRAGMLFSPNGTHYGIAPMLPHFFRQAGLTISGTIGHFIEFSYGTEANNGFYHEFSTAFQLLGPLMMKTQVIPAEEWHALASAGLAEMQEEDFCAGLMLLTIWGEKPR